MRKNNTGVLAGVLLLTPLITGIQSAIAVPLDGGTLDPLTIPKYVTPLVIPPVMNDSGVSNDYDIAVREFKQQILPGGIWNTINGRADAFPATKIWSYGPATDPLPDSTALGGAVGVAPAPNSQFNYPSYTIENETGVRTSIDWMNELTTNAWDQAPGATPGDALPHLFAVDQSLHWANPIADCESGEVRTDCAGKTGAPYTGPVPIITHVHGAHVGGSSDGYTEAWWLPDADNINCVDAANATGLVGGVWNVVCQGSIANQLTDESGALDINTNNTAGVGNFSYPNTQPSSTIWYHDHSLGMTRLNVMAGPAGFWLIRDNAGETGLDTTIGADQYTPGSNILPGPAPVRGENLAVTNLPASLGGERNKYREIPIVIQGRSFNADGSLFYPDNRAFFEGLNVEGTEHGPNGDGTGNGGQFGYGAGELQIDMDPATSDIAPIWNPEAFFNTMVVNGVTWPKLEVAPAQYRFRLLNGSNSRFLNLALKVTDAAGNPISVIRTVPRFEDAGAPKTPKSVKVNELRFWQIGTEQSLKPTVTAVRTGFATNGLRRDPKKGTFGAETPQSTPDQALLMGLAERADVIVDFRGLPDGTIITMTNTAPDAPFGGFPDVPADPSTTGQVMQFVVNSAHLGLSPTDELHPQLGDTVTYLKEGKELVTKKVKKEHLSVILNPDTAASNPWDLVVDPAALDNFDVAVSNPVVRELALIEESSHLICVDFVGMDLKQLTDHTPVGDLCQGPGGGIHATAFAMGPMAAVLGTGNTPDNVTLWSDPITTNINPNGDGGLANTAETWRLYNFTADAHPIHVHLVKFKVLGRNLIGGGPSGVVTASLNGTEAWEDGWKDTVISYPGDTTDLEADFDINGLYVWHCHIVEHEDNEMMVPMCVGRAGVDCPAQLF